MSLIFSIFSMTAVAGLTLALQYWRQSNHRMLAEQNARVAMETVTSELRQAIVDPDPAGSGYLSITPAVSPTGVLTPNANSPSAATLVFTEPSSSYDATVSGFSDSNAANYQRVNYYIQTHTLHRQVITYANGGAVASVNDSVIVGASPSGTLSMSTLWQASNTVRIQITAQEERYSFTLSASVSTVAR